MVTTKILVDEDESQIECAKSIQMVLTNKAVLHNKYEHISIYK